MTYPLPSTCGSWLNGATGTVTTSVAVWVPLVAVMVKVSMLGIVVASAV